MEGHRGPPPGRLHWQRRPRLTEGRLVRQRLPVQVGPVRHQQLHQVHLRAGEPGLLKGPEPGARTPSPEPGPHAPPPRSRPRPPHSPGPSRLRRAAAPSRPGPWRSDWPGAPAAGRLPRRTRWRPRCGATGKELGPESLPSPCGSCRPPASPHAAGSSPAWPHGPGGHRCRLPPAAGSGCPPACTARAGPGPPRCCPG